MHCNHSAVSSSPTTDTVGPRDTSEPVLVISDVDVVGGLVTGENGIMVFSSVAGHNVTVMQGEEKLRTFGKCGMLEDMDMIMPAGVAINHYGEILVACHYHLKKFSLEGVFLGQTGDFRRPDDNDTIYNPAGMTIGKDGRVYVVESGKHRVKIFNSDLSFHSSFNKADKRLGSGRLNNPMGIASNSRGELFVADMSNYVVQVFSLDGEFLFRFGMAGHSLGSIQSPVAVTIDHDDYVYVASGTGNISIFDTSGMEAKLVKTFGSFGAEVGLFKDIKALHIDKDGRLYVGEVTNKRIQVFE